jgi:hypothetical protein
VEPNPPLPPTPADAPGLASLAADSALSVRGLHLDYSPASLANVETLLDRLRAEGAATAETDAALLALGCYLGEMFVRAGRGRWRATGETPMKDMAEAPLLVELDSGDYCNPIGRVRKCFESGGAARLPAFWEAFGGVRPRRAWWRRLLGS